MRNKEIINRYEILENITPVIENTLMRYDLIPLEIDFQKENHHWFLRIFLYSYSRAVTLEDCERVSRSMENFIDELIPVKYYLEVSSPGLDRKMKSEKEFVIFIGKLAEIKFNEIKTTSDSKKMKARILDAQVGGIIKLQNIENDEILEVKYSDIHSAKLIIEDNIGDKSND